MPGAKAIWVGWWNEIAEIRFVQDASLPPAVRGNPLPTLSPRFVDVELVKYTARATATAEFTALRYGCKCEGVCVGERSPGRKSRQINPAVLRKWQSQDDYRPPPTAKYNDSPGCPAIAAARPAFSKFATSTPLAAPRTRHPGHWLAPAAHHDKIGAQSEGNPSC